MRFTRRKRLFSILMSLALVGVIFLSFQFFSHNMLDTQSQEDRIARSKSKHVKEDVKSRDKPADKYNIIDNQAEDKKCKSEICDEDSDIDNGIKNAMQAIADAKPLVTKKKQLVTKKEQLVPKKEGHELENTKKQYNNVWEKLEAMSRTLKRYKSPVNQTIPRGVYDKWAAAYQPDDGHMFTCILSQEKISYKNVNDDYCDCEDHSDEPGTSACQDSRFYCHTQVSGVRWVSSGRVTDGLCDCCDGSDEWDTAALLPAHVHLPGKAKYGGIYQAPCTDQCGELRAQEEQRRRIQAEGAAIKERYIREGRQSGNADQLFGVDGEFYLLSNQCFQKTADKYIYNLCPFKKSEQSFGHAPSVSLGSHSSWLSRGGEEGYKLLMTGGDRSGCPQGKQRQTMVIFECGLKDELIRVSEDDRCIYSMHVSTPAAC